MKIFTLRVIEKMKQWTLKWSHSPHMAAGLFFIAFIESSFFPIPPDVLMVSILLINAERWRYYAFITTAGSVLGALFGYFIGWALWSTVGIYIVDAYNLHHIVSVLQTQYSQYVFLTVFIAAFTPIPYKLVTITAGLFHVSIISMFFASVIGRGLRYFLVAYFVKTFGKKLNSFVVKYFNIFSMVFVAIIVAIVVFIKLFF